VKEMWKFNLSAVRGPLSVGKSMIFVDRGHDHFGHRTPDNGQRTKTFCRPSRCGRYDHPLLFSL